MGSPLFSFLLLLLHVRLLLPSSVGQSGALLPEEEVTALTNITTMLGVKTKRSFGNKYCQNPDPDSGIGCDCKVGVCHVSELPIEGKELKGVISKEVENLVFLKKLILSENLLHDSIPDSIGSLSHLEILDLSSNFLGGNIPNMFYSMPNLTLISLGYNNLEGAIPVSLGALPKLKSLHLPANPLAHSIPSELGNISTLLHLNLEDNQLSGTLPPELGKLTRLIAMEFSGNDLAGELPQSFGNLKDLQLFSARGNKLSGQIPGFIGNWPGLSVLNLMGNKFEGSLPTEISNLRGLTKLWVTDLRVNQDLPFPQLSKLIAMEDLILRNCGIAGEIPAFFANMRNLTYLDLSYNYLSGSIPASLGDLTYLSLARNHFNGPIPHWVPDLPTMDFSYNSFSSGSFLQSNKSAVSSFNCCTPATAQMDSSMQLMNKACHRTYSSLYINCGGEGTTIDRRFYEQDISTSPFYVSPKKNWAYSISGEFISSSLDPLNNTRNITCGISAPDAPLYTTARISPLTLDYYGLCLHNGNYNVTLHFAEIVFTKEDDHSILGKRLFDIFIQDKLIEKDFNIKDKARGPNQKVTINATARVFNKMLNIHLNWAGKGSIYVPPEEYGPLLSAITVISDHDPGVKLQLDAKVGILVAAAALLVALSILWKYHTKRKKLQTKQLQGEWIKEKSVTYKDILDATGNFNDKCKIGGGGGRAIYKADLRGEIVAVKVLKSLAPEELLAFGKEVHTLQRLKHDNLVGLLGWYTEDSPRFLIYEYMEKKCLQTAFMEPSTFTWKNICDICLDIAKGLCYLHEQDSKIAHRNIKPSNILLDRDFKAKISDFTLAWDHHAEVIIPRKRAHGSGTAEYMANEYTINGECSDKTDVFSYGVVILRFVSGTGFSDNYKLGQQKELFMVKAYRCRDEGRLLDLMESSVKSKDHYTNKEALTLLKLGMMCIDREPRFRPTMREVVDVLQGKTTAELLFAAKHPKQVHQDYLTHGVPSTSFEISKA